MRDDELIPIEDAARELGIEPKRLRGFIARNGIADPIGDMAHVYGWSLRELARRQAAIKELTRYPADSTASTSAVGHENP